jgi:hypothetical protein
MAFLSFDYCRELLGRAETAEKDKECTILCIYLKECQILILVVEIIILCGHQNIAMSHQASYIIKVVYLLMNLLYHKIS